MLPLLCCKRVSVPDRVMTDPLQLPLRDIHMPPAISWWPPAAGWWGLACLLLSIILLSCWWIRRRQLLKLSAVNLAKQELLRIREQYSTHQDQQWLLRELSVLLRRLSISEYPRLQSASLTGDEWLQFLDKPMQGSPFKTGVGRVLLDAPYRPQVEFQEIGPLFTLCEDWIDAVKQNQTVVAQ